MRRPIILILILLIVFNSLIWGEDAVQNTKVNWTAFSRNLVKAIATQNDGLRISALSMIVKYSENLDVDDAVFDIVWIFRNSNDTRVRQLALVTLHKMENSWAMDFLKRNLKFEENETIRNQSFCIVKDYYAKKSSPKEVTEEDMFTSVQ